MGLFGTGQAVQRLEDQRFLTGNGRYTDDICLANQAYLYVFRSPYAHGDVARLDVSAAQAAPGVLAVLTGPQLLDAGVKDLPGSDFPASSLSEATPALRQQPLAREKIRYVGEPVAGVVACTYLQAKDAADLIELDVDELPAVVSAADAIRDGAPQVHDSVATNLLGTLEFGDRKETDKAFERASQFVTIDIVNNRLSPTAIEPRGCIADFDTGSGELTLHQGCQGVHTLRGHILNTFDIDQDKVHVVCPDVGGAFGLKFFLQCETVVAIAASMQLGRPVKWIGERSESFLADLHARDQVATASLAIDDSGQFLAMRTEVLSNTGAYCSQFGPLIAWWGAGMNTGCYDIPSAYVTISTALTHTVPTDAYRGAGRPEAAYIVERLVDKAAFELGLPPDEIRRRNFIRPEQFPYTAATGRVYDSGEYEKLQVSAMQRADWDGFANRRAASESRDRLRGIGLIYYTEICSAGGSESAELRFEENGRLTMLVGTQASGQGHETSYAPDAGVRTRRATKLDRCRTRRYAPGRHRRRHRRFTLDGTARVVTVAYQPGRYRMWPPGCQRNARSCSGRHRVFGRIIRYFGNGPKRYDPRGCSSVI